MSKSMHCRTVILATQHSSIILLVTLLLFPSKDPSFLPSLPLSFSVCVIWWNTWIPGTSHSDRFRNCFGTSATKFPWWVLEESLVHLCQAKTWMYPLWNCCLYVQHVDGTRAAEGRAKRKRSGNLITSFDPWILPCLKPDLPLDFSDVSQKISFCV